MSFFKFLWIIFGLLFLGYVFPYVVILSVEDFGLWSLPMGVVFFLWAIWRLLFK